MPPSQDATGSVNSETHGVAKLYVDVALAEHPPVPASAKEHAFVAASDDFVSKVPHDLHVRTQGVEHEIRGWVALGWMPSQSARRVAYEQALAAQPEGDTVVTAAVTARMQESLGLDWMQISSPECEYDPTMCEAAARQVRTGARLWFDRAATNYALCDQLGTQLPGHEAWAAYCHDRATHVRYFRQ